MKSALFTLLSAGVLALTLGGCSVSVDRDHPRAYYWNDGPRYGRVYGPYNYHRDWDDRRVIIRDRDRDDGFRAHVDLHD